MHINFHLHTPRSRRALIENISLLWAENHFPLECHLMAPTLPFYGPRACDSSHPYLIDFKYSSDSNPRFPHFASCDSSYGWFNTSLILEGRKYLQWLTERWDFQLSFEEGSSQEPGLWWMTAHGIYLCAACALTHSVMSGPLQPHGVCSLPGSSVHGISQERILEQVFFLLPGIFPTQGLNPYLLCLFQADSYPLRQLVSPKCWWKPLGLVGAILGPDHLYAVGQCFPHLAETTREAFYTWYLLSASLKSVMLV